VFVAVMPEKIRNIASLREGTTRGVDCDEESKRTIGPRRLETVGKGVGKLCSERAIHVEAVGSADETFQQLACH
jgi:hypothetical protein